MGMQFTVAKKIRIISLWLSVLCIRVIIYGLSCAAIRLVTLTKAPQTAVETHVEGRRGDGEGRGVMEVASGIQSQNKIRLPTKW
jgi:hypothetical protein